MSKSVYEIATEKILEHLEKGVIPWQRPWKTNSMPTSVVTGKEYRGINRFLLALQPYECSQWITFKQANKLGGKIRKGERSYPVFFFQFLEKEDNEGKIETIPLLKYYRVWNLEQTEGIEYTIEKPEKVFNPIESAETIVRNYTDMPPITYGGNKACYSPLIDTIQLPTKESFHSSEGYYSTLFHEMIHSTGHEKRINRPFGRNFGDHKYSKEELVAEFGAAYLCSLAGIDNQIENNAAYINSWIKALKNNQKWLVSAASQAEYAVNWIKEKKHNAAAA
jgi:antirestriction protein ArdC